MALLALLGAACGGDDGGGDAGAGDIDLASFCEGAIEGEARFIEGPETDDQDNPTEEGLEQFRNDMEPFIEQIDQNTPEEIESEVDEVLEAVRTAVEEGDQSATESEEFVEAESVLDEYVYDNCDFDAKEEFTAVDYAYQDVPQTMDAGLIALRMQNEGTEVHEAVIFKFAENEQRSIQDLLSLPEDQGEQALEFRTAGFAGPGAVGFAVADLDAGRYAMVCFIPLGTKSLEALEEGGPGEGASPEAAASPGGTASPTSPVSPTTGLTTPAASPTVAGSPPAGEQQGEGEGGPPHFTQGMVTEFRVT